jgi:hypothetical protein
MLISKLFWWVSDKGCINMGEGGTNMGGRVVGDLDLGFGTG